MNTWDVWYADYPFEEDNGRSKPRPAIVLSIEPLEILAVKITHHNIRDNDLYDTPIEKWKEAGLDQPSVARISKSMYLNKNKFLYYIGQLHPEDIENIYYQFIESKKVNDLEKEQSAATNQE